MVGTKVALKLAVKKIPGMAIEVCLQRAKANISNKAKKWNGEIKMSCSRFLLNRPSGFSFSFRFHLSWDRKLESLAGVGVGPADQQPGFRVETKMIQYLKKKKRVE